MIINIYIWQTNAIFRGFLYLWGQTGGNLLECALAVDVSETATPTPGNSFRRAQVVMEYCSDTVYRVQVLECA